ncbi:MAG: Ig-like domain-containing protein [archaeon]
MAEKNYEYHKQNDYPGERIAERNRVIDRAEAADKKSNARVTEKGRTEGLKADARVAEKGRTEGLKADARVARTGRMDDKLMDSEIERSTKKAAAINIRRNAADTIGLLVIAGLIAILLAGSVWGFMTINKQSNGIDTLNSQLDKANSDNYQLSAANKQICGITDTNPPTVLYMSPLTSVSPSNTEMDVPVRVPISIMFSEDMDPLTINKNTFKVEQRTTPKSGSDADQYRSLPIEGAITYSDRKATFTSDERFYPNQIYGNVFTVTVTKGVKDIAGNPLVNRYIWSFTTGSDLYITGATTLQTG